LLAWLRRHRTFRVKPFSFLATLSSSGGSAGDFLFHSMFFPATYLFSGEDFGVVALVDCFATIFWTRDRKPSRAHLSPGQIEERL
jgi:hypothetical protein